MNKIADHISILLNRLSLTQVHIDLNQSILSKIINTYKNSCENQDDIDYNLLSEILVSLSTTIPELSLLAGRVIVESQLKPTLTFSQNIFDIHSKYPKLFSQRFLDSVRQNHNILDDSIIESNDYSYDLFAVRTLMRTHLLSMENKILESIQYCIMRVAVEIGGDINNILYTYRSLSEKYYTHATPTIINAGKLHNQLSSCFLITNKADSLDGIMDTAKITSQISSASGGIGLSIHNIRAAGSHIFKSGGTSKGILPLLKTYNELAKWWDQGGGKRKGAFAIYLEPWHADIFVFLDIKKNHGKEELRARDLFTALWTNDLFMERVESDGDWTLMCPNECPGLSDCYGDEFRALYTKYERENKGRKTIKAQELWFAILESQIETGTPYMLYKDACNEKSNQKNLGTIKSSNLCTEIVEYTAPDEVAVCNLASIALPKFVEKGKFDFDKLFEITYQATLNLNKIIDNNYYPVPEAKNSNLRHRPIGLGVQGLADAFILMRFPFTSDEAKQLNKDIFETIYYAALTASKDLAKVEGPYETYKGSPISQGIFQFDMWGVQASNRWEWDVLREEIKEHGVRNSLLVAPMPTASTSQILGNNECFEPYTSNIYSRRTLSGEFPVVNKHLLKDLVKLGLWNDSMKNRLIAANGSIQDFPEVPNNIKELYRTVWEIKQKDILDMAADRGAYIDQSQSLNIFIDSPNFAKLTSMHFYAWKKGLKTGMYYLRTKAARDAIQFTVDKASLQEPVVAVSKDQREAEISCSLDNPEGCEMCGS